MPKIDLQENFFLMLVETAFEKVVGADPRIPHKDHTKTILLNYFRKPEIKKIDDTKERALAAVRLLADHLERARGAREVRENPIAIESALGMLGLVELVRTECDKVHREGNEIGFENKSENTTRIGKKNS